MSDRSCTSGSWAEPAGHGAAPAAPSRAGLGMAAWAPCRRRGRPGCRRRGRPPCRCWCIPRGPATRRTSCPPRSRPCAPGPPRPGACAASCWRSTGRRAAAFALLGPPFISPGGRPLPPCRHPLPARAGRGQSGFGLGRGQLVRRTDLPSFSIVPSRPPTWPLTLRALPWRRRHATRPSRSASTKAPRTPRTWLLERHLAGRCLAHAHRWARVLVLRRDAAASSARTIGNAAPAIDPAARRQARRQARQPFLPQSRRPSAAAAICAARLSRDRQRLGYFRDQRRRTPAAPVSAVNGTAPARPLRPGRPAGGCAYQAPPPQAAPRACLGAWARIVRDLNAHGGAAVGAAGHVRRGTSSATGHANRPARPFSPAATASTLAESARPPVDGPATSKQARAPPARAMPAPTAPASPRLLRPDHMRNGGHANTRDGREGSGLGSQHA